MYVGNYEFWYESSQLLIRQMKEANKKFIHTAHGIEE